MAEYACQDCSRCTRSGLMTLLRGATAVVTLGVSEFGIAASDFVRRTCPGCAHPIDEHAVARHFFPSSASVQPRSHAQPSVRARVGRCRHYRFVRTREGNGHCPDCGDIWDAYGNRWDLYGRQLS